MKIEFELLNEDYKNASLELINRRFRKQFILILTLSLFILKKANNQLLKA